MVACRAICHHPTLYYDLYNLDDRPPAEWKEFLTKEEMDRLLQQVNPPQYTDLVDDKLRFYERCLERQIPTPPVLGVLPVKASRIPAGIPEISTEEQLRALFRKHDNTRLFFKTVDGSYGVGILSVSVRGDHVADHLGTPLTAQDIFRHCHGYRRSFLVQPHLAPHPDLTPLMPGLALGTFRVYTILQRHGQTPAIPFGMAIAKVPIRTSIIDNFHHGATGNLLCQVNVEDGTMTDACSKPAGVSGVLQVERHPDTHVVFREFTIPYWQEVMSQVTRAALNFGELPTLGWDVAITTHGVTILEANWHYDPDGFQILLNRGVKSEITALYRAALAPN
jgi:hypothetical protein